MNEELYSVEFYDENRRNEHQYVALARCIYATVPMRDAIDVGCGAGLLGKWLAAAGVRVTGVDGSEHSAGDVQDLMASLESWVPSRSPRDVAICIEVAEHLPESSAGTLVNTLCRLADEYIVFSAAPPGQGGVDHINEQPAEYWLSKFRSHPLRWIPDEVRTWALRVLMWESKAQHCYARDNFYVLRPEGS